MSCVRPGSLSFKHDIHLSWVLYRRRALRCKKVAHRLFIIAGVLFVMFPSAFYVLRSIILLNTQLFTLLDIVCSVCPALLCALIGLFYLDESFAADRVAKYQREAYFAV